ncbi:MAG: hypothetical protein LAT64_11840 [Phycisphaerales bacterium]|nr:hypothetical protein [Planctomycetota bacterium]MCH8509443.1 hypothetical protein [Phycisphaerales bacterium]
MTGSDGAGKRRRSFRLDRPQCRSCGGCACGAARVVKTPVNLVRLGVYTMIGAVLGMGLGRALWACPGCGARFWAGVDGE